MHGERSPRGGSFATGLACVLSFLWTAFVLLLTLRPGRGSRQPFSTVLCFFCGPWGVEMAMLNVLLFVPLGITLPSCLGSGRKAMATIVLLVVGIEISQRFIPGRYPSLGDVLFNCIGGAVGVLMGYGLSRRWRGAAG